MSPSVSAIKLLWLVVLVTTSLTVPVFQPAQVANMPTPSVTHARTVIQVALLVQGQMPLNAHHAKLTSWAPSMETNVWHNAQSVSTPITDLALSAVLNALTVTLPPHVPHAQLKKYLNKMELVYRTAQLENTPWKENVLLVAANAQIVTEHQVQNVQLVLMDSS